MFVWGFNKLSFLEIRKTLRFLHLFLANSFCSIKKHQIFLLKTVNVCEIKKLFYRKLFKCFRNLSVRYFHLILVNFQVLFIFIKDLNRLPPFWVFLEDYICQWLIFLTNGWKKMIKHFNGKITISFWPFEAKISNFNWVLRVG